MHEDVITNGVRKCRGLGVRSVAIPGMRILFVLRQGFDYTSLLLQSIGPQCQMQGCQAGVLVYKIPVYSCDLVIAPMNATSNLAAACGGDVWFIHSHPAAWTMLGRGHQHWYPHSRSFFGETFQDWDTTMKRVENALRDRVSG